MQALPEEIRNAISNYQIRYLCESELTRSITLLRTGRPFKFMGDHSLPTSLHEMHGALTMGNFKSEEDRIDWIEVSDRIDRLRYRIRILKWTLGLYFLFLTILGLGFDRRVPEELGWIGWVLWRIFGALLLAGIPVFAGISIAIVFAHINIGDELKRIGDWRALDEHYKR